MKSLYCLYKRRVLRDAACYPFCKRITNVRLPETFTPGWKSFTRGKRQSHTSCEHLYPPRLFPSLLRLRETTDAGPRPSLSSGSTYGYAQGAKAQWVAEGNIAAVAAAAATPHINIPSKSARVKHLFSTKGIFQMEGKRRVCSNSAEATITRLAGGLSICILSTEEFITMSAFSLLRPSSTFFPSIVIDKEFSTCQKRGFACYLPISFFYNSLGMNWIILDETSARF